MNRFIGLALLVIGVILLVMGINAADSFASKLSRFFTDSPTDKAIWLIIGGVLATILGAGLAFFAGKRGK